MHEVWKDAVRYEGLYQVSNTGKVKSLERIVSREKWHKQKVDERILKPANDGYKYLMVSLYKNRKRHTEKVHRLVADAFIPNPSNKPQINHIDGVKHNNNAYNLEWVTEKENIQHAVLIGLRNDKGENNPNSKLNCEKVIKIRSIYKNSNLTQKDIAKKFNISNTTVSQIVNRKTWNHI